MSVPRRVHRPGGIQHCVYQLEQFIGPYDQTRVQQPGMRPVSEPVEALCAYRALHESPKVRTHNVGLLQPGLVPSALDPRQRNIEPQRE